MDKYFNKAGNIDNGFKPAGSLEDNGLNLVNLRLLLLMK